MSQVNNQMEHEQQAPAKQNTETDDVFQRMLEIRFDEPVTVKVNFQDDDPDYLHQEEASCQDSSDDHIYEKSPGSKNVIILGTKKTPRRSTDEISNQRCIKRTMSTGKTTSNVQNQNLQNNINDASEKSTEIQKETQTIVNEVVLPGNTNSILSCSENVKNTGSDVEINVNQEILAVNSNLSKKYSKSSLTLTNNSEEERIAILAKEEIKNSYKTFPRTKVTSRRKIKKFPGKMASMKKSIDKMETDTKSQISLGKIEDLGDSTFYSPQSSDQKVHVNDKTNSIQANIQAKKSDHMKNHKEYKNIPNEIFFDSQRNMTRDLRRTNDTTNNTLLSLQNITQDYIYDPRIEALKTVAENIVAIFPYLNYFLQTKRLEGQDKEILKRAQNNFYASKIESFGLSYSTVVSFILPYKHNTVYMNAFYQLIAEIAKKKKLQGFLQHNLEILCSEMISWTENKKLQIKVFNDNSRSGRQTGQIPNTTPGNTTLNQKPKLSQLISPQKPSGSPGNINQSKRRINKTERPAPLRFAAGPPGREIQITYDPEIHRLNEPSTPSVQSNLTNNTMVKTNQMSYLNQWTSPVTPNLTITESCNRAPQLVHNPGQSHYDSASWKSTHQQQSTPLQTPTYPQAFESFCATRNASVRPPPPPYHQIQREPQIQQHIYQTEEQNANNLRSSVIQERSSVSRDSGFMSPVGDNSAIDQMDNFINDISANIDCPTPMITHVTSMNPNANYAPPSKCKMCGTITNLRCLGCNRDYYCGPHCQGLDWRIHKAFCHK